MDAEAIGPVAKESLPRLAVIRTFPEVKATIALLRSGIPVVVLSQTSEYDRQRLLDLLTGWALGSDGQLDRIGPNTVLARPPGCPPIRLARTGIVPVVEEVFASEQDAPMSRDEEERLLPLALAGSLDARRRIVDTYAELATLFALRIRPRSVSESMAVRVAQEELDRLVTFPSQGPLLASLVDGIVKRLSH
jgi:hypothetical protein